MQTYVVKKSLKSVIRLEKKLQKLINVGLCLFRTLAYAIWLSFECARAKTATKSWHLLHLFIFQWISFLCYSCFDHPRSLQTLIQKLASKFVVIKGQSILKQRVRFVLFLGEVSARQFCFEIYWPLVVRLHSTVRG